ncbi:MAG: hypothetical protein GF307_14690 [candidate division Zixibacteria bacterium]|nr:hypothetical protein [candidate division Zixibacteria bacterium]
MINSKDANPQPSLRAKGDLIWSQSYLAGTLNPVVGKAKPLGGTEVRCLAEFDGDIYAGTGMWMDELICCPNTPAAQVLRLDGNQWGEELELGGEEVTFEGLKRQIVVSCMSTVEVDGDDKYLLVGSADRYRGVRLFYRKKTAEGSDWGVSVILPTEENLRDLTHTRSVVHYRDSETRENKIIAGLSNGKGFWSVNLADLENGTAWTKEPVAVGEEIGEWDRVMAMAKAVTPHGERLFAVACGKVYRRKDGASPEWKLIGRLEIEKCDQDPGELGFRGLTAVPGTSENENYLLAAFEGSINPGIYVIKNIAGDEAQIILEKPLYNILDNSPAYGSYWQSKNKGYSIIAYNRMTPCVLPFNGRKALLMGIEVYTGAGDSWNGWEKGGWFIAREVSETYSPNPVYYLGKIDNSQGKFIYPLIAVRDILVQSGPNPMIDFTMYHAGFDANRNYCHNTGWIYKGDWQAKVDEDDPVDDF